MLMFMSLVFANPGEHARAILIEPELEGYEYRDTLYVTTLSKWHLYKSFILIVDNSPLVNDSNFECGDEVSLDDFFKYHERCFEKVKEELNAYVTVCNEQNTPDRIKVVTSTFLKILEKSPCPTEFFAGQTQKAAFDRAVEEDQLSNYFRRTFYLSLTHYISYTIQTIFAKKKKLLSAWFKMARQLYVDAAYMQCKDKPLQDPLYKSISYSSLLECTKPTSLFNEAIQYIKQKSCGIDSDVISKTAIYVFVDLAPYLIAFFLQNSKKINGKSDFFVDTNSFIPYIMAFLQIDKDYRDMCKTTNAFKYIVWGNMTVVLQEIGELLSITNVHDEMIDQCKDSAAALNMICDTYIEYLSDSLDNSLLFAQEEENNIRMPETYENAEKTGILLYEIAMDQMTARIIYNGLESYVAMGKDIEKEITSIDTFFCGNLCSRRMQELSKICGFKPQKDTETANKSGNNMYSRISQFFQSFMAEQGIEGNIDDQDIPIDQRMDEMLNDIDVLRCYAEESACDQSRIADDVRDGMESRFGEDLKSKLACSLDVLKNNVKGFVKRVEQDKLVETTHEKTRGKGLMNGKKEPIGRSTRLCKRKLPTSACATANNSDYEATRVSDHSKQLNGAQHSSTCLSSKHKKRRRKKGKKLKNDSGVLDQMLRDNISSVQVLSQGSTSEDDNLYPKHNKEIETEFGSTRTDSADHDNIKDSNHIASDEGGDASDAVILPAKSNVSDSPETTAQELEDKTARNSYSFEGSEDIMMPMNQDHVSSKQQNPKTKSLQPKLILQLDSQNCTNYKELSGVESDVTDEEQKQVCQLEQTQRNHKISREHTKSSAISDEFAARRSPVTIKIESNTYDSIQACDKSGLREENCANEMGQAKPSSNDSNSDSNDQAKDLTNNDKSTLDTQNSETSLSSAQKQIDGKDNNLALHAESIIFQHPKTNYREMDAMSIRKLHDNGNDSPAGQSDIDATTSYDVKRIAEFANSPQTIVNLHDSTKQIAEAKRINTNGGNNRKGNSDKTQQSLLQNQSAQNAKTKPNGKIASQNSDRGTRHDSYKARIDQRGSKATKQKQEKPKTHNISQDRLHPSAFGLNTSRNRAVGSEYSLRKRYGPNTTPSCAAQSRSTQSKPHTRASIGDQEKDGRKLNVVPKQIGNVSNSPVSPRIQNGVKNQQTKNMSTHYDSEWCRKNESDKAGILGYKKAQVPAKTVIYDTRDKAGKRLDKPWKSVSVEDKTISIKKRCNIKFESWDYGQMTRNSDVFVRISSLNRIMTHN